MGVRARALRWAPNERGNAGWPYALLVGDCGKR